jgi:prepilin-type N-terminal cleavage/methylation domain-containing protein
MKLNKHATNHCLPDTKGFTLIELLVAITIMSTLFALGYASYRNYAQRQTLYSQAREIESYVKLAQNYAFSGKDLTASCGTTTLDGYEFLLDTLDATYSVYPICANTPGGVIKSGEYDDSIYTVTISQNPIRFKTIGHGTNLTDDATISVRFASGSPDATAVIYIQKSGEIYMQ